MSGRQTEKRQAWNKALGPALIVDDDLDDAKLTKRAIEALRPIFPVRMVHSGKDLLAYLENKGSYSDLSANPIPSLVLLDLKMPEMDGFEVLKWVKREPKHAYIPVVVVSALEDVHHLKRAYSLYASSYLFKPINVESVRSVVSSLNIAI